jgi:hypothetical protein
VDIDEPKFEQLHAESTGGEVPDLSSEFPHTSPPAREVRPVRRDTLYSQTKRRFVHRAQLGFSFVHLTLEWAQ